MGITSHLSPARIAVAVALLVAAAMPSASARPGQEGAEERRARVRERRGEVALEIDVAEARSAEIEAAMKTIEANVITQRAAVQVAERAVSVATEQLAAAEQAVAQTEGRIAELNEESDRFIVEAYVNPPVESRFDVLRAESLSDASIKQAILELQADTDADVLDRLAAAQEDLRIQREERAAAAAEAERKRETARTELSELEAALSQQRAFAADAEATLEHKLAESAHLAAVDAQLSRQIAAEQAELARRLAASGGGGGGGGGRGPGSSSVSPAPGGLAVVSCPHGGAIRVAGAIAGNLQNLLNRAAGDGVALCGWGYRSPDQQVELRRQHCGSSEYAIYQMPAWQCSPPTARPGLSMHERGLAVDFNCSGGSIGSRGSPCYRWLAGHAPAHGLYNLPSEPWHWSTNGN